MICGLSEYSMVGVSVRLYQMFLLAYPTKFRHEYGSEMAQIFRDSCLRTLRQRGLKGMPKLWFVTMLDLAQSVITEHTQKEAQMTKEMKPEDIRRAGWALIWGAIVFVLGVFAAIIAYSTNSWSMFALLVLVFVSLPLLVFGVLGLRNRYGAKVGSFGRNILLVGAILGPLTSVIGFFLMSIDPYWFIIYAGHAVLFICLTLFGITALNARPLPRWNILPVIAGLGYPAIIFFYVLTSIATGDWSGYEMPAAIVNMILITIQALALLALGYILKSDVPDEVSAIA